MNYPFYAIYYLPYEPLPEFVIVADMVFPQQWKKEHPNYLSYMPLVSVPSLKAVQLEAQALGSWKGTCDRLSELLGIVLAEKIPGAWLVQIKGGGHGLMYQYPDKFSRIVLTFLET